MTINSLKPTLLVLMIGLMGILFQSMLDANNLPSSLSISAYFDQLVSACQEQHSDWDRETCERIVRGEIWVGMTDEMIRASIGEPNNIDQPRDEDPSYEKWTYRTAQYGEESLQIQAGILLELVGIQSCSTCDVKPPRPVGQ